MDGWEPFANGGGGLSHRETGRLAMLALGNRLVGAVLHEAEVALVEAGMLALAPVRCNNNTNGRLRGLAVPMPRPGGVGDSVHSVLARRCAHRHQHAAPANDDGVVLSARWGWP